MKSILSLILFLFVSSLNAEEISGIWATGKHNTLVEIETHKQPIVGKVVKTDAEKGEIGTVILKKFSKVNDSWHVTIFAPERDKHFPAILTVNGDVLEIKVDVGFFTKDVEWQRQIITNKN
jgi:uncharacterized protein (DUF2147 family)